MYFQVKLCNKKLDDKTISNCYIKNNINAYVFYRSHLGIMDNSTKAEKIRVTYSVIKDVKYNNKSLKAQTKQSRTKNVLVPDRQSDSAGQQPISRWVYEEANLDHEDDPLWNVPKALVREAKLITGIMEKANILRADVSTANHRYNAMLNRTYIIEKVESSGFVDDEDHRSSNSDKDLNVTDSNELDNGSLVKVKFESDYFGYDDEDLIRVFDDNQLSNALELMISISINQAPNISVINLAQYCPNIFWNLAFKGNVEDRLAVLSPSIYNQCSKRRRRGVTNLIEQEKESKTSPSNIKSINRLKCLHYDIAIENNFAIMQNIYKLDAEAKISNLEKLETTANAYVCTLFSMRHRPLLTLDDQEIVEAVVDKSGAMK